MKDKKNAADVRFDEISTTDSLITMFRTFKGKSSYDQNFKILQHYILISGNKNNVNWYFDVAFSSRWLDLWSEDEWSSYIDAICEYCKPDYKRRIEEILSKQYFDCKKEGKGTILLKCLKTLRASIKKDKEKNQRKRKVKEIILTSDGRTFKKGSDGKDGM